MADNNEVSRYSISLYDTDAYSRQSIEPEFKNFDPILEGPFGYQLEHRDAILNSHFRAAPAHPPPLHTAGPPSAVIAFHSSFSSSGWTVSGLPIETTTYINRDSSASKKFIRYGAYGFMEQTPALLAAICPAAICPAAICPADLCGQPCIWDETWVWDSASRQWVDGCPKIRLCPARQTMSRPQVPPVSPYQYPCHHRIELTQALLALKAPPAETLKPLKGAQRTNSTSGLPPLHPDHYLCCISIHKIRKSRRSLADFDTTIQEDSNDGASTVETEDSYGTAAASSTSFASYHTALEDANASDGPSSTRTAINLSRRAVPLPQPLSSHHDECPCAASLCRDGHGFPASRFAAFAARRTHEGDALVLLSSGRALRTEHCADGEVDVVLCVPDAEPDELSKSYGQGRYVIDGAAAEVREAWEEKFTRSVGAGRYVIDGTGADVRIGWLRPCFGGGCGTCWPGKVQWAQPGVMGWEERFEAGLDCVDGLFERSWEAREEMLRWEVAEEGLGNVSGEDDERSQAGAQAWDGGEVDDGLLSRWREARGR